MAGAEDALYALARDLIEEISAARALELTRAKPRDSRPATMLEPVSFSYEDDEVELADHQQDLVGLVAFRVRQHQRLEKGKEETVHQYQETRTGLHGLQQPGQLGAPPPGQGPMGWIPEPDWLKGEQEWKAKGEAAWKKNEWKHSRKPKNVDQIARDISDTRSHRFDSFNAPGRGYPASYEDRGKVAGHLVKARDLIQTRPAQAGDADQDKAARAYHELAQAHEHIVSHVVPYAKPEDYPSISEHLQRIAGHMQDIDQLVGAQPEATRKMLGSHAEVMQHAGEERRGNENAAAEAAAGRAAVQAQHQQAVAAGPAAHMQFLRNQGIAPPPSGAAAVHPAVGQHLLTPSGHTISGHSAKGMVPMAAPGAQAKATAEAFAQQAQASREAESRVRQEAAQAARAAKQEAAAAVRAGIAPQGSYAPLSDEQYALHAQQANDKVEQALRDGLATDVTETMDGHGQVWKPERSTIHGEIIRGHLDAAVDVPSRREALMLGGLPGAGKSTLLKKLPDVNLKDYIVINPDDIKDDLANRGLVPEIEGLSPGEAAALTHEESSYVAHLIADEAMRRGKNIAWDITMKTEASAGKIIDRMQAAGYNHIHGIFVDIPAKDSETRMLTRMRTGLERYRKGKDPVGGRLVPFGILRATERPGGQTSSGLSFDALKGRFGSWEKWSNPYRSPPEPAKLVARSEPAKLPGDGIQSVEELRQAQKAQPPPFTGLNTEAEVRAREKGTAGT